MPFDYALIIGHMFSSSAERKKRAEEAQQSVPANGKPAESNGGPVSLILCLCPPVCLELLHACFDVLTSWANKLGFICSIHVFHLHKDEECRSMMNFEMQCAIDVCIDFIAGINASHITLKPSVCISYVHCNYFWITILYLINAC